MKYAVLPGVRSKVLALSVGIGVSEEVQHELRECPVTWSGRYTGYTRSGEKIAKTQENPKELSHFVLDCATARVQSYGYQMTYQTA